MQPKLEQVEGFVISSALPLNRIFNKKTDADEFVETERSEYIDIIGYSFDIA